MLPLNPTIWTVMSTKARGMPPLTLEDLGQSKLLNVDFFNSDFLHMHGAYGQKDCKIGDSLVKAVCYPDFLG